MFSAAPKDFVLAQKTEFTDALSLYRSQKILGRSKHFVPEIKWIDILCKSQTFCARPKDDLRSVNSFFFASAKSFGAALNAIQFLV
jgi:hypothetical protein